MKRDLPLNVIQEEALFSSAHAALTFALNFSSQQFGKSAMATLIAPAGGSGKGLGGLDGSAQAGIVRAELERCGELTQAILIAKMAPKFKVCECKHPCCSGKKPNSDYDNAIEYLCKDPMTHVAGTFSHFQVRKGLIMKFFGEKIQINELAELCNVTETTVHNHKKKIFNWLKGENRDSPGAEFRAWREFEEKLILAGLIEG